MDLETAVLFYVVLLISLVVHEASHALFALWGGDTTAYVGGQVTLNPIPHIQREPFGTVVLPILMLILSKGTFCFGYASTPIDAHWAHRHPKRAALMSFAGPLANMLLVAVAFFGMKALIWGGIADNYGDSLLGSWVSPANGADWVYAIGRIATVFVILNVILAIFNLLPWPPLDGAGIVEGLAPRKARPFYAFVRSQPLLLILGIIAIWQFIDDLYRPVWNLLIAWL